MTMAVPCKWPDIVEWIERSESLFIKKLSRNDCSWADDPDKHQDGFYVPREIRTSDFFPPLSNAETSRAHIFDSHFSMFWPISNSIRTVHNVHFSNKGSESHITLVPEDHFSGLSPASLVVVGRLRVPVQLNDSGVQLEATRVRRRLALPTAAARYWCLVIDSLSDEAELLETAFSLSSDFHFGLFLPDQFGRLIDEEQLFIEELTEALKNGSLAACVARNRLPTPEQLAKQAQDRWLRETRQPALDPFVIDAPGDAVMRISRDIEYELYQQAELRQRAAQVAALLLRGDDPVRTLVKNFRQLDGVFLSAAQTRKSRAGLSFERHVQRLLVDGRVRHEAQMVFGSRRPDFVLPDVRTLNDASRRDALILSLKTTLRERWKQLGLERLHAPVFLATVDDRVSTQAIDDMEQAGIVLVVPESLKTAKEACYARRNSVISFKDFFCQRIRRERPALIAA